ncbi:GNAT family N-acetyltransferase [Mucilaginibacter sp. X4EP1]|uniref:GNAT family N-acetyltransferase n=1 Tax=Mucilaginibacter sp. X4EP1 TaxID=2723092 RepID=UPI0038F61ABB
MPYVEISAVCTHPDFTGKGYARALIYNQIRQLRASGKLPYLHVRGDNTRAYQIYQDMGFVTRKAMIMYVLNNAHIIDNQYFKANLNMSKWNNVLIYFH